MKKFGRRAVCALMAICAVAALTACGNKDVTGTYKAEMRFDNMPGMDVLVDTMGISFGNARMEVTLELKEDDTFTMGVELKDVAETLKRYIEKTMTALTQSGTYKVDGETLTLTVAGEDVIGTIKGKKISLSMGEEMAMEFEK